MAWRKRLRTASFRRIRFNLTNSDASFGRRIVNHSYPKRDFPYSEDMGRKAREFTIEAFIVGTDYLRQRDRLKEACEKSGPGKLVHPYYGNVDVVCVECEIRESAIEGGIARFNLVFREAGSLKFPQGKSGTKGILSKLGFDAAEQAVADFGNAFEAATSQPQALVDSVSKKVTEYTEAVDNTTAFINRSADNMADLAFSIRDLRDDVDQLINTPAVLAQRIIDSLSLIKDAVTEPRESLNAYKSLFGFGASDQYSSYNTATRQQQTKNLKAVNNIIRAGALFNGAESLTGITFESTEDAKLTRDAFLDEINSLQEDSELSDDLFQMLDDLRVQVIAATPPDTQKLPSVIEIMPSALQNSLVLSYDLYGSLDEESDIISRNQIKNPALIPGGKALKVLSNG